METPCYSVVKYTPKPYYSDKIMSYLFDGEVSVDSIVTVVGVVLYLSQKDVPFPGVHLKQDYTPRLHTLLSEIALYQYRRKRLIAMSKTHPIYRLVLQIQISIKNLKNDSVVQNCHRVLFI